MLHIVEETYVDEVGVVTLPEVVEHASFIEVRETSHVFNLLKLGWVHLLSVADVHLNLLKRNNLQKVNENEHASREAAKSERSKKWRMYITMLFICY